MSTQTPAHTKKAAQPATAPVDDSAGLPAKRVARPRSPGLSRDKILMVATRLFAEEGFAATSVRDIATECGITLPSIYHFFGDKQSLYDQCVATSFSDAAERMASAMSSNGTPKERVRQALIAICDMLLNNDNLRRLLQRAMLRRNFNELGGGMVEFFPVQFHQMTEEVRKLGVTDASVERAFAMYALALGAVQFRPVAERVGLDSRMYSTPVHLAEYILRATLPELR